MQLKTMAMQISEKNWSVAVSVLGSEIGDYPPRDSYGKFVVINTFAYSGRPIRYGRQARSTLSSVSLNNCLLDAEDFHHMFDYDKRTKNLENFFDVTQINSYPIKMHPDQKLGEAIDHLNELWHGPQED